MDVTREQLAKRLEGMRLIVAVTGDGYTDRDEKGSYAVGYLRYPAAVAEEALLGITPARPDHARDAEQALAASTWQRQQWGETAGPPEAVEDAHRAYMWEMERAKVHALLGIEAAIVKLAEALGNAGAATGGDDA